MGSEESAEGTYRVEKVETDAGTFVEVHDSTVDTDRNPVMFLPASDAVELGKEILDEFGVRDS